MWRFFQRRRHSDAASSTGHAVPRALSFGDDMMETIDEGESPAVYSKEAKDRTKALQKMRKQEINRFLKSVQDAEHVDLCFVIDSTGSMAPHIASVKANIKQIVRQIMSTNRDLKLRLAVVAYRDYGDEHQYEVLDFVSAESELRAFEVFVGCLVATGGDDAPEDMAGAIHKANGLDWQHATRVVFLIADAPCHGKTFHTLSRDRYPNGSLGYDIVSDLRVLQNTKSKYGSMALYFGRITDDTDKMIKVFQANGINMDVVSLNMVGSMASSVTTAVRRSISTTISLSTGSSSNSNSITSGTTPGATTPATKMMPYSIVARSPTFAEWKREAAVPVHVYRTLQVTSVENLRAPLGVGKYNPTTNNNSSKGSFTRKTNMFLRQSPNPFAEGQIRLAYHGQLSQSHRDLHQPHSAVILKLFKRNNNNDGSTTNGDRKQYLDQMEVSNIAYFLANEYNKSTARPAHCGSITYLPVSVVEVQSDTTDRCYCAEAPLPDGEDFVKFGNNTGYWNADHLDETLLRFALFTYEATDGYLMLTDLQGVKKGNGDYVLTDPAILCKDLLRFGGTNLGPPFMKKCVNATKAYMHEKGWKMSGMTESWYFSEGSP